MKRYLLDSGIMGDFIDHRRGVPEKVRDTQDPHYNAPRDPSP